MGAKSDLLHRNTRTLAAALGKRNRDAASRRYRRDMSGDDPETLRLLVRHWLRRGSHGHERTRADASVRRDNGPAGPGRERPAQARASAPRSAAGRSRPESGSAP